MTYCKETEMACLEKGADASMLRSRISAHFYVEDPTLSFDVGRIGWGEGVIPQRSGVILSIGDEFVDQSNINSAIESVTFAYGDRIKKLVGCGIQARLVMGFFFDTSKVAAFGFDISQKTLSSLVRLGIDVTLDVFPCSDLED